MATMSLSTTEILNSVLQMHCRSLPMYLADARPWSSTEHAAGQTLLQSIVDDQATVVDDVADLIQDRDEVVDRGTFPLEFADLHDLSLDFLIKKMVLPKQATHVAALEKAAELVSDDEQAAALCQRALGIGRAHLDSLHDYVNSRNSN